MEDLKQIDYLMTLEELEYIFEGATVPLIVLGETAKRIRETQSLEGLPELEVGVIKRKTSDYSNRTFRDRWGEEWANAVHKVLNVPVNVKLISRHYKFFDNPDEKSYSGGIFKTANPFSAYWKVRGVVK